jgi:hypothetical protein
MPKGWIRIDRAVRDNWIWKNGPFTYAQAWLDLLLGANHKAAKISIKGTLIQLEIGQQARSELTLSKEWGWSRTKTRRFLGRLENDQMLIQQKNHLTSVITICNYKSFQGIDSDGDTTEKTCNDTTEKHLKNIRKTSDDTQSIKGRSPDNENPENNGNNQMILKDLSACADDEEQQNLLHDLNSYEKGMIADPAKEVTPVTEIFNYWLTVMDKKANTAFSDKRVKAIKKRLKDGYTVADIKTAIFNCSNTDHNMGRGPKSNGTKYNDIELICRHPEILERFRDNPGEGGKDSARELELQAWASGDSPPASNKTGETFEHDRF